jgi:hypothetical protein
MGNVPTQPLIFFFLRRQFRENYVTKTETKKVIMILGILFRVDGSCILVHRIVGVASAAGVEALLKTPRSVITIDESIIFTRFYEKIRG